MDLSLICIFPRHFYDERKIVWHESAAGGGRDTRPGRVGGPLLSLTHSTLTLTPKHGYEVFLVENSFELLRGHFLDDGRYLGMLLLVGGRGCRIRGLLRCPATIAQEQ